MKFLRTDTNRRPAGRARVNALWWLHPAVASAALLVPLAVLAFLVPESAYHELWETPKYFSGEILATVLMLAGAFVLGSWAGAAVPVGGAEPQDWTAAVPWRLVRALFFGGFCLCLVGYATWFALGYSRGANLSLLLAILRGEGGAIYSIRETFSKLPGVTTMTQFGSAVAVLGVLLGVGRGWHRVRGKLIVLGGLAIGRAIFLSERLAFLELLVPAAVLYLRLRMFDPAGRRSRAWRLLPLFPFVALALLYIFFTVSEYFRSWSAHYSNVSQLSLGEFALFRLAGYYLTAMNNGAVLLDDFRSPLPLPYFTLEWWWRFPLVNQLFKYEELAHFVVSDYQRKLFATHANPEFNNPCGLILPALDWGVPGAVVFLLWAGLLGGVGYRLFRRGHVVGLVYYPILFLGILELPRFLLWFSGRAFPTWLLLLPLVAVGLKLVLLRSLARKARPPAPAKP